MCTNIAISVHIVVPQSFEFGYQWESYGKPNDIHYQGKSVADCTCDTFLLQTVTYLPSKLLCNTMRQ